MNKKIKIIIIVLVIIAIVIAEYFLLKPSEKLKICPDEWYVNKMPCIIGGECGGQYFVLDGERREFNEFDVDWIKENCGIEPTIVQ